MGCIDRPVETAARLTLAAHRIPPWSCSRGQIAGPAAPPAASIEVKRMLRGLIRDLGAPEPARHAPRRVATAATLPVGAGARPVMQHRRRVRRSGLNRLPSGRADEPHRNGRPSCDRGSVRAAGSSHPRLTSRGARPSSLLGEGPLGVGSAVQAANAERQDRATFGPSNMASGRAALVPQDATPRNSQAGRHNILGNEQSLNQ